MTVANPPLPLLVDVDTGLDDALALAYLAQSSRVELRAVTCVAGNVELPQVVHNTLAILDGVSAGRDLTVAAGARRPLLNDARPAYGFHGCDGVGGLGLAPEGRRASDEHAIAVMKRVVEAEPGQVTLLALGPLTNVALFIRTWPDAAAKLARIVFMGGAVSSGNATAVAEFNAWHDPEALDIVLRSDIPTEMFALEVFSETVLPDDALQRLADGTSGAVFTGRLLAAYRQAGGVLSLGDAGAAVIVADPQLRTSETLPVLVQLSGAGRGQTIVDRRGAPGEAEEHGERSHAARCAVVVGIDAVGIANEYLSAVGAAQ